MRSSMSSRAGRSASRDVYNVPDTSSLQEPSTYHGKMRTAPDDSTAVDIILGVSTETVHAVTMHQPKMMFQSPMGLVKEIVWDHSEKSVHFGLDDGFTSPTFVFPVLTELETHLSAIVALPDLEKPPEQVYIGVLIGQNLPSPIQQRRASLGSTQPSMLPMSKRRELLRKEQPVRNATSRERLGVEYMRTGYLCFTCSISGDLRGLTLGIHHMRIFPSPDCHDRSACLFSYAYEHLESCEVAGTRLELRFRTTHQLAKQPSYLVFQSLEAQYIREAMWYLKNGTYMDASLRDMLASPTRSLRTSNIEVSQQSSDIGASRRASVLMFFTDADSLKQRIDACCRVIGCQNLAECSDFSDSKPNEPSASNVMVHINTGDLSSVNRSVRTNPSTSRVLTNCLCEFHTSCLSSTSSDTLTRQKSKLSRDKAPLPVKSIQSLTSLLQSMHYAKMFKFQGQLQKRQNGRMFHLRKAWHPKFVVLFETPVGGFLCYYDKITHCPGMTDTPKERRVIDLSSVLCIRPVSVASPASRNNNTITPTMHAFDVVTLYRTWTFAAVEPEEYEVWLHVLTESVEKHATIAPDKVLRFPVKLAMTGQTSPTEATSLEISSHGVSFCTGNEAEVVLSTWYYTDLEKWSVVFQQGCTCCLLRCQSPPPASLNSPRAGSGDMITQDYLFRTPEASVVCLAIEFYVGKCMAKLEILAGQCLEESRAHKSKTTLVPDPVASKRVAANPKVEMSVAREHPIENVSLAPIRRSEDAMISSDVREEQREPEVLGSSNTMMEANESEAVTTTLVQTEEIISTATEESLPIVSVESNYQNEDDSLLLVIDEPTQELIHDKPVLSRGQVPNMLVEVLPPSTAPETGVDMRPDDVNVVDDTTASASEDNDSEALEKLHAVVADVEERETHNSDMESIDLLEEGGVTELQVANNLPTTIYTTLEVVVLESQLNEGDNTIVDCSLSDAELREEGDKVVCITLQLEPITSPQPPDQDEVYTNDNDMDCMEGFERIEENDQQNESSPVVIDQPMQSEIPEINNFMLLSGLDTETEAEEEGELISSQTVDFALDEVFASFADQSSTEIPLATSALEPLNASSLSLEGCILEHDEEQAFVGETLFDCQGTEEIGLVGDSSDFGEEESPSDTLDEVHSSNTPPSSVKEVDDSTEMESQKGTADVELLKSLDDSSQRTSISTTATPLLLLEYKASCEEEKNMTLNDTQTKVPTLEDEKDDRTSEWETSDHSDTFNSCASETDLVHESSTNHSTSYQPPQDASIPPRSDCTDDVFEDAFDHFDISTLHTIDTSTNS